jgi:glucokinase
MNVKLTLSINDKTIEKAKRISRKKGKSISKMVEEYLDSVAEKEKKGATAIEKTRAILKGKITNKNVDWKKVKTEYLIKKYGL